jgi:hypothetical protein
MSTDNWCTPKWLAEALGPFDLDPCSNAASHVRAGQRFGLEYDIDGIEEPWCSTDKTAGPWSVFCNPPYSNPLPWAKRLRDHTGPWCALLKLDPSTKWWAVLMEAMPTVAPFRKRLKFEGEQSMTANFPSVLVYSAWRPPAALVPHLWLPTYASAQRTGDAA